MAFHEPLSRGGIMRRVGVGRDVMTFWIRGGVLRAMPGPVGPGIHLKFEWYEANIAAIMNQLRILGVKIEGMLSIGSVYRDAIAWGERYGLNRDDVLALGQVFSLHRFHERGTYDDAELERMLEQFSREDAHGATRITERIKAIHAQMPRDEFRQHYDPFLTVTEQPKPGQPGLNNSHPDEMTYFWRVGEGDAYRFAWGAEAADLARQDGAIGMIAVDVTAALYTVWNRPEGEGE